MVLEEDPEAGRRLRQPVDLFLERDDLVARLAQRRRQPLVLGARGGELGLDGREALLERTLDSLVSRAVA